MPAFAAIRSEFADDPDFGELLAEFAAGIPGRMADLRAAFESGTVDQLRMLAHQLKGAGGGYGFPDLSHVARELEQACKFEPGQISLKLADVLDYLERIEP